MALYTRQQLVLLLVLLAAAGAGLGVVHWRAAHPELVDRLEQLDGQIAASAEALRAGPEVPVTAPRPPAQADQGDREARPRAPARVAKRQLTAPDEPLDLNRATLDQLTRLPGVGPVLARRILEAREEAGRFGAVDDLATVRGLGPTKLEKLRPFVGIAE